MNNQHQAYIFMANCYLSVYNVHFKLVLSTKVKFCYCTLKYRKTSHLRSTASMEKSMYIFH